MTKDNWTREKNWKLVYTRSCKVHRANQLGFLYPRENEMAMIERESVNLLFVCSKNQWRSPTAEKIYSDKTLINVRSRGTSSKARRVVKAVDLKWADIVFAMEKKHLQRLVSEFPGEMRYKEVYVLDIPDEYKYLDPVLVEQLVSSIDPILAEREN